MDIQEFKDNIPSFIEQAIDVAGKISNGKIKLSVSLPCIEKMDPVIEYLHHLYEKDLMNDTVAWNVSVVFGVLLGEIIIKENGFHWAIVDDLPLVETDDQNRLSPITKIYKIIIDEDHCEGSVSSFYDGFKALQQYSAMSEEEKEKITIYI